MKERCRLLLVSRGQTLYQLQHGCITSSARRRKGLVSACTGFRCIPQECELQYFVCIAYGSVVFFISLIIFTRTDNRRHMGNSTAGLQCLVPFVLTETPVHSANCWSAFAGGHCKRIQCATWCSPLQETWRSEQ